MSSPKSYRELMDNVRDSHVLFKKAFREMGSWKSKDEKAVAKARKLLDTFKEHSKSLDVRLTPLINALRPGNEHVIDEVLEFLAVDVLALWIRIRKGEMLSAPQARRVIAKSRRTN